MARTGLRRISGCLVAAALGAGGATALAGGASWTGLTVKDGGTGRDTVTASGRIVDPATIAPGAALTLRLGEHVQTLPADRLVRTKRTVSFRAKPGESGVKSFTLTLRTGAFTVSARRIETGDLTKPVPFVLQYGGREIATRHPLVRKRATMNWKSGAPMEAVVALRVLAADHALGNTLLAPGVGTAFAAPGAGSGFTVVAAAAQADTDGVARVTVRFTDPAVLDSPALPGAFGPASVSGRPATPATFSRVTAGDDGEYQAVAVVEQRRGAGATIGAGSSSVIDSPGADGAPSATLTVPAGAVASDVPGVRLTPLALGAQVPALPPGYVLVAAAELSADAPATFDAAHAPTLTVSRPAWSSRSALAGADLRLLRHSGGAWTEQSGRGAYDEATDRVGPHATEPAAVGGTGILAYAAKQASPAKARRARRGLRADGEPGGDVAGVVVDAGGAPLAGQVVLTRAGAMVTGADGAFALPGSAVTPESVELVQTIGAGGSSSAAASAADAAADGVTVVARGGGALQERLVLLSGRTFEAGGKTPSPGATITFTESSAIRGMTLDDGGTPDNPADDVLSVPDLRDLSVSEFRWTLRLPNGQADFASAVTGPDVRPIEMLDAAQNAGRSLDEGVYTIRVAYDVAVLGEVALYAAFRFGYDGKTVTLTDLQLPAAVQSAATTTFTSNASGTYSVAYRSYLGIPLVGTAVRAGGGATDEVIFTLAPGAGPTFVFPEVARATSGLAYGRTLRAPMPTPRTRHATAVLDGRVWCATGGTTNDDTGLVDTVEVFDPATNTWTTGPSVQTARARAGLVALGGKLYLVGGETATSALSSVEVLDPATGAWALVAPMPVARTAAACGAVNGKLWVAGGGATRGVQYPELASVSIYDPATNTWSAGPTMPQGTIGGNLHQIDGVVYVPHPSGDRRMPALNLATGTWSNRRGSNVLYASAVLDGQIWVPNTAYGALEVYEPATDTWGVYGPFINLYRIDYGAAVVGDTVYCLGGTMLGDTVADGTTEAFRAWWRPRTALPAARTDGAAAAAGGRIWFAGGTLAGASHATLDQFDPARNHWRPRAPMATARSRFTLTEVGGRLYAVGGEDAATGSPLASVERYDPVANRWTAVRPMTKARSGHAAGAVSGKLYVFGGPDASVEAYDPATDTWTARTSMPGRRTGAMASVFGATVSILGGHDGSADRSEVYEFAPDLNAWTTVPTQPGSVLLSRFGAALVDGRVYVNGGIGFGETICTHGTIVYDPVNRTFDAGGYRHLPERRCGHATAELGGVVYVLGGELDGFIVNPRLVCATVLAFRVE